MNLQSMIRKSVADTPPSGIRKYFDLINEMKDAISLGIGEPDFETPWSVREEGIWSLEKGKTFYSSNAGFIELRQEISKYMKAQFSMSFDPFNEILVTVGGSEAIDLSLRMLVGPGDEVLIPEPCFVAYKGCTLFTGATAVAIPLKAENRFRLKPEELLEAITPRTKVLVLGYPNNPTGATMDYEDYEKLVDVLRNKDIIVISDEIYAELIYAGKHTSIAHFPEMRDRTIVINGFSKTFAMTGWRIGFACCHPTLMDQMKKIHQLTLMCSPTTAQYAAMEALRNGRADVARMVEAYNRRRLVMVDGFRACGLDCFEPLGAFYVFPDVRNSGLSSEAFCEQLLVEERVLMIPGGAFGDSGEGFARATYATSLENIREALTRICRFMSKHSKS